MAPDAQDSITPSPASPITAQKNGTTPAKAGLEDVVAGTSEICFLDGKRGILAYRGYNIHDLVKGSFEETSYLLFYSKLPNAAELKDFTAKLVQARQLPEAIKAQIKRLPKHVHPMAALRTLVSELGFYDSAAEDM